MAIARTAEHEQVRAYLLAQTREASWLDLWPRVMQTRLELLEALRGVTPEQARFKSGQDQWSILEVASHVLEYSTSVRATIEALSAGRRDTTPVLSVLTPPADGVQLESVRADLLRDAVALSSLIVALPDDRPLDDTVEHDWFGPLHAKAWFLFQRVHDMDHTRQVASIKAAEDYPA